MLNLYSVATKKNFKKEDLGIDEKLSVIYHDVFDYPLNFSELVRWRVGKKGVAAFSTTQEVRSKNGNFFIEGKEGLIYKRTLRKRVSERKLQIAVKAAKLLSLIPNIKMIAVTGSLAMGNSLPESDIDLMVITKEGTLWTTRLFAYLFTRLFRIQTRKPKDKQQQDKLCLNIWMDENDLSWNKKDRNIYTAHEIAQIVPLINKEETYEKFIGQNKWILNYWPSAIIISSSQFTINNLNKGPNFVEKIAFKLQYQYMKSKITREIITKTRALFHPQDWGKTVLTRLKFD